MHQPASRAVPRAAVAPSTAPPPSSSSRRRDAHALASRRVKYDPAPPPPPPPPNPSHNPRHSPLSDADPQPSASLVDEWHAHLGASLSSDWDNARHPRWDERGLETYDAEPVLPEDVDGLHGASGEGDFIVAERGAQWDGEDEWLEVLKQEVELEAQREEEQELRAATPPRDERADDLAAEVPPAPPPVAPQAPALPALVVEPSRPALRPVATPRAPTPRSRSAPLRLEPVPPSDPSLIAPYIPSLPPSSPDATLSSPASELLVSRHDWRLSAPLRRYLRRFPPPLFSRTETDTTSLGHNRLVGVGVDAARIGKHALVRGEEQWGWKVRVPESERGAWPDADAYRKRCVSSSSFSSSVARHEPDRHAIASTRMCTGRLDRLLDLSKKADEQLYLASLSRQGTPAERELKGTTLCRAVGAWLTDASRADEMAQLDAGERERRRKAGTGVGAGAAGGGSGATSGGGMRAVACFEAEDGRELTEDRGWKFACVPPPGLQASTRPLRITSLTDANTLPHSQGSILRFTLASARDQGLAALGSKGPQPPPGAAATTHGTDQWFVQGTLLEVREDQLIVAFDELDMWTLGDEAYQCVLPPSHLACLLVQRA